MTTLTTAHADNDWRSDASVAYAILRLTLGVAFSGISPREAAQELATSIANGHRMDD
jgi:hypothetical protein